jgi:hypothetical protein
MTVYMHKDRGPENFGFCEPMRTGYFGQLWEPLARLGWRGKKVDPT